MNMERIKGFAAGVLLIAMLSATFVFAGAGGMAREINYGVGVVLNGRAAHFDEDSRPFVMDGRTFLPLRAMADLLGLPVDFDPETNTAYVGHLQHPLVGMWAEELHSSFRWQHHFEFFADGGGRHVQIHADTGEERNGAEFIWSDSNSSIAYVTLPWDDIDFEFEYDIRFAVYGDVLGVCGYELIRRELLILTLIIGGEIDTIMALDRVGDNPAEPTPGDLPYTTIDTAGNRVYVLQVNDTLWSVAMGIYGDGMRYADIIAANNITEQQAAGLPVGTVLIIPD